MTTTILNPDFAEAFKEELNETTEDAMRIAGVLKETDLLQYISHGDGPLSEELFLRLQQTDKKKLAQLIRKNIIDQQPKKHASKKTRKRSQYDIMGQLEGSIAKAKKKIETESETKICFYILYEGKRLHHLTYEKLKATDPQKLNDLIQDQILSKEPQKYDRPHPDKKAFSLEVIIEKALKRRNLQLNDEKDICRYIPDGDKYLHPSTFRSLQEKDPERLKDLIIQYVLKPKAPQIIEWHKKEKDLLSETPLPQETPENEEIPQEEETKLDKVLEKTSQSVEAMHQILEMFQSRKAEAPSIDPSENCDIPVDRYLRVIQNQLIKRIRSLEVDYELWDAFVELLEGRKR